MAFVPFSNCVQVEMRFTQDGQKVENVYHVTWPTGDAIANAPAIETAFAEWWDNPHRAHVANNVTLTSIVVRDMVSPSGLAYEYPTFANPTGGGVGTALPNGSTVAVKWTTGLSGRSYRGRTFHIGLQKEDVLASHLQPGSLTALLSDYQALITKVIDAGGQMVVASRISNGAERVSGVITPILAAVIDPIIDSQRRRLPGRGT